MNKDRAVYWVIGLLVVAVALGILLFPQAKERLAPEFVQSWVAIEPAGSGLATVGPVAIEAGTSFTLHAVLEAQGRQGPIYYTEAPALAFGDQPAVAPETLRRWDRLQEARFFWFTVEGAVPYIKLKRPEDFNRVRWTEFLRLDWPKSWSIPGTIAAANGRQLIHRHVVEPRFGTQRYQVRIELFDSERQLIPTERFTSWGGDQLPEQAERFPTAYAAEPGGAGPASLFFGLTHVELPADANQLLAEMNRLTGLKLAYERLPLLASLLGSAATSLGELPWRRIDLAAGPAWGDGSEQVAGGDLVQVGERWVVLYRDENHNNLLDGQDLCLDFATGATVRLLADVFTGSGQVDVARLKAADH